MPTTFTVFSLGVLPDIDTTEGNTLAENAGALVGQTFGGIGDALLNDAVAMSPGSGGFGGGNPTAYEQDNGPAENFSIDGGPDQVFDSVANYNATITFIDGTTANITAVVFQDTNGNTYWAPEFSGNGDQTLMESAGIRSLTLNSVNGANAIGLAGDRESWNFVTCYVAGTRIATQGGDCLIDDLSVGDLVLTRDHGAQAIRWIGKSTVKGAGKLAPVRIAAGALGADSPKRDLYVSRQHRVLLASRVCERMFGSAEILVPAIKLISLPGISVAETAEDVTYYHLMTDDHQVIYAEGAASETLLTGPQAINALGPDALAELQAIFPDIMNTAMAPARPIAQGKRVEKLLLRHERNRIPVTA